MAKDLKRRVAWQGYDFRIPADWDLDAVRGDETNGYLQVSDGERCSLELRWNTSPKEPDFTRVLKRYEKQLRKKTRRSGPEIHLDPSASLEDRDSERRQHFSARTEGRGRLYGFTGWSARSKRITLAQITGAKPALGHQIFESLGDRLREPGWNEWEVYDLEVSVPDDYRLIDRRLIAGYIYLHFAGGTREYAVERWGPAGELLRGRSLEDWIVESRASLGAAIGKVDEEGEPVLGSGHAGLRITGKRKTQWRKSRGKFSRFSRRWDCRLWVCEGTNRIYAEHYFFKRKDSAWLDEVGVVCHSAEGPAD